MMQNLIPSKRQNTNTGDHFDTVRYGSAGGCCTKFLVERPKRQDVRSL
jgi:hypothetical protein